MLSIIKCAYSPLELRGDNNVGIMDRQQIVRICGIFVSRLVGSFVFSKSPISACPVRSSNKLATP
jgi:hypothetical protein